MQSIKSRIITLIEQGKSNQEIIATLGCAASYPSLCRLAMGIRQGHQAPTRDAILAYLEAHPKADNMKVAIALGTRPETVSRAKAWARRQEQARCAG